MDIKPGWKGGTRLTFDGKGNHSLSVRFGGIAASDHGWCQAQVHLRWGWHVVSVAELDGRPEVLRQK